jgi:predicted DNA-binding transcriptional regulator YafY
MNQHQRLSQLHTLLLSETPLSLADLAQQMDCSRATAARALVALQAAQDRTIEQLDGGWRYALESEQQFELPGMHMPAAELVAVARAVAAAEGLQAHLSTGERSALNRQLNKLLDTRALDRNELNALVKQFDLLAAPLPGKVLDGISEALLLKQQLQISYLSLEKKRSQHVLSPQCLVCTTDGWMLHAWCHQRKLLQAFSAARIMSAELRHQKAKAVPPDALDTHIRASHTLVEQDSGLQTARIRFSADVAREAAAMVWHPQQFCKWDGGDCILTLPFDHVDALVRRLLPYLPSVKVEAPKVLQRALVQTLQKSLEALK